MRTKSREVDVPRLLQRVQDSRRAHRVFRENRREMVRQFVGPNWSDDGTSEDVPVNLISLYVSIVGRNLIAKNPRVMLSTFDRAQKPAVAAMQSWANKEIEAIHLQETLQRIVTDALFSIGIAKVALATPAESASLAWGMRAGQPLVSRIDLDDFVFDAHTRDILEAGFVGHRYRVPLDVIKDSKIYSRARKNLAPSVDQSYNLEGDERISMLGRGINASDGEDFEDFIDCWEIYVPRHKQVFTFADNQMTGPSADDNNEPLRVQRWLGVDEGPYHVLGMGVVPGNAMPKAPIQDLLGLHEASNRAYRKVIRGLDRIKELTLVQGGAMEDGSRVMQGNDGEILRVDNPDQIQQVVMGGKAVQEVLGVAMIFKDLFSFQGGNLELLGGRGPQSKTATQDTMLNQNAGAGIADMQERTVAYVARVLKAMCWYWWHDPFKVMRVKHSLPGLPDISIDRKVTPEMRRRGRFEDLEIEVDPYSMQHATPQSRLAGLNQIVQNIITPMMPLLQQQGKGFDVDAYLSKVARYMDQPDLSEIITIVEAPQQESSPSSGDAPKMPVQTERKYIRENMPGRTRQGDESHMVNSLLGVKTGGNPNESRNGTPAMAGR